jgi:uncharacterized membrane protein YbaN (DUF454 family)
MFIYRWLLIVSGTISLILGITGIFLPLLPTTPFLLLTAFLYFKSSPKAYNWLIGHKYLGPYIINYREKKIIPLKAKIAALTLMWLSVLNCMIFFLQGNVRIQLLLWLVCIGVTIHILSFKSKEDETGTD